MDNNQRQEIYAQIYSLEQSLTGDMMKDLETKDKIHKLRMRADNVTPSCSVGDECINCSG